ncbi:hypothetical protein BJX96DRAFT_186865 [Aspergillus floccosus]
MDNKPPYILLKGGTLLIHGEYDRVVPRTLDLLIQDDRIAQINRDIHPPAGTKIIDCTNALVSPGFIDTHRHLWQSQQKGLHCDQILLDYFHSGNLASSHYAPNDVFCGVLSSCMEAIDSGTTTVVDHAHVNYSSLHNKEAIRGQIASGIRSVFCYCVHPRVTTWQPELKLDHEISLDTEMENFRRLAKEQPFGPNGRVRLGFAMDTMFVHPKLLKTGFDEARKHGAHLITSHVTRISMMDNMPSPVAVLNNNGLLGPDVLLSHGNNITPEELRWVKTAGAHFSSTPLSELQMGHGHPICLEAGFLPFSSIGTDSNSICTSSIPTQASTALQATRARQMAENMRNGTWDGTIGPTVEDAFNLGTLLGARAIGLEDEIGSLEVGKKADIVIFQGQTPTMVPAGERHPIAGIILHSSVRDVQTVIVDGIVRKENGSLCLISVPDDTAENAGTSACGREILEWKDVAKLLRDSHSRLEEVKSTLCDENAARNGLIRSFLDAMAQASSVE